MYIFLFFYIIRACIANSVIFNTSKQQVGCSVNEDCHNCSTSWSPMTETVCCPTMVGISYSTISKDFGLPLKF